MWSRWVLGFERNTEAICYFPGGKHSFIQFTITAWGLSQVLMWKNVMSIEVRSGFVAALHNLVGLRQKNVAWAHSAATVDRSG